MWISHAPATNLTSWQIPQAARTGAGVFLIAAMHLLLMMQWLNHSRNLITRQDINQQIGRPIFQLLAVKPEQRSAELDLLTTALSKNNTSRKATATRIATATQEAHSTTSINVVTGKSDENIVTEVPKEASTLDQISTPTLGELAGRGVLNLNTRAIARELNKEPPVLAGATRKGSESVYSTLKDNLGAPQVNREGVRYEKKFLFDGRPVSKVITPYGTYCIQHRKPGENPDLTPPPIPVSCGNL